MGRNLRRMGVGLLIVLALVALVLASAATLVIPMAVRRIIDYGFQADQAALQEAGTERIAPAPPRFEDAFIDLLGGGPGGHSKLADATKAQTDANPHVIEAHERILDTFKRRAGEEAAAAMRAHVDELELLVRKRFRELLERPASIVARPGQTI